MIAINTAWQIYCFPGRAIAHLRYLFPGHKRGNLWATARRNESPVAHFIFATFVWLLVVVLILAMLG